MYPQVDIELGAPPGDRWRALQPYRDEARALLDSYLKDLGSVDQYLPLVRAYSLARVPRALRGELRAIGDWVGCGYEKTLLANIYYDLLKVAFGCTAFAVDTPDGPVHARNLDWWTEDEMLSRFTKVMRFHDPKGNDFSVIGWPGFVGALSGVAPGRFAVTLNAVLSGESTRYAKPISLFIRTVLEKARDYDEAVHMLSKTAIFSDCLLLVTGVRAGEMCVIERTPSRSEIRRPKNGAIVVTNDYRVIDADSGESTTELAATSCGRYDQALQMIQGDRPQSAEACFRVLNDESVRMGITVQQMAFSASQGQVIVR